MSHARSDACSIPKGMVKNLCFIVFLKIISGAKNNVPEQTQPGTWDPLQGEPLGAVSVVPSENQGPKDESRSHGTENGKLSGMGNVGTRSQETLGIPSNNPRAPMGTPGIQLGNPGTSLGNPGIPMGNQGQPLGQPDRRSESRAPVETNSGQFLGRSSRDQSSEWFDPALGAGKPAILEDVNLNDFLVPEFNGRQTHSGGTGMAPGVQTVNGQIIPPAQTQDSNRAQGQRTPMPSFGMGNFGGILSSISRRLRAGSG